MRTWRIAVALSPCVLGPVLLFTGWGAIPQDLGYHDFADKREVMGVAFFGDVITNLPFVVVGLLGLRMLLGANPPPTVPTLRRRAPFLVFSFALLGTGIGSGLYHLDPNNATLVWDRVPLVLTIIGFFVGLIGERVNRTAGAWLLAPLCIAAVGSVFWWARTDDLRPYALMQFCPIVSSALILLLLPGPYNDTRGFCFAIGAYAAAKVPEYFDHEVFEVVHVVGGHGIKHILAGVAAWLILRTVRTRI